MDRKEEHNQLSYLLKKKLADKSFEYKEEYWLAAEQLIEADEQKRRIPFWWMWGLGLVLALGLIGMLVFASIKPFEGKEASESISITNSNQNHDANNYSNSSSGAFFPDNSAPESNSGLTGPGNIGPGDKDEIHGSTSINSKRLFPIQQQQIARKTIPDLNAEKKDFNIELEPNTIKLLPPIHGINPKMGIDFRVEREAKPGLKEDYGRDPRFKFGIHIGWNRFEGKNTAEQGPSNDLSPHVGLYAKYRLAKSLDLIGGASYFSTDRFSPSVDIQSRELSFGLVSQLTRYELQRLHYLDIPFALRKYIGVRHSIQASLHNTLLLGTRHQLNKISENAFGETSNEDQGSQSNFKQGLNRYTIGIGAAYRFRFTPNLSLGFDARVYPSHLFEENFYNIDRSSPWMLSLQLEYDLFKVK